MTRAISESNLYSKIVELLQTSRQQVLRSVNQTMVYTYYEIGRMIVEDEQQGKQRAEYGKQVLKDLSRQLAADFGKGFSVDNLQNMRQFYLTYSIYETPSRKFVLSWSHYLKLMRIANQEERKFYEIECSTNNWSLRELQRQFDSGLYERLALRLGRDKADVRLLAQKGHLVEKASDAIKDPYILEFLGLPERHQYSETVLEQAIIDNIQSFLKELGKGFMFVSRQERISFDERHFYIDLVFYNRILRCFVIIDLKIGDLKHQDLGQMQMYVNYYDRFVKLPDENKTIGIILCKDKNQTLVEITLPENNDQIFASRYQTVLPDKQAFIQLLNQDDEL